MIAYDTIEGVRMTVTGGCRIGMARFSDRALRSREEARLELLLFFGCLARIPPN